MKKALLALLLFLSIANAQSQSFGASNEQNPHFTFANGTTISTKYDSTSKVFTIGVENNPSEIEVTIIKDGVPVDWKTTDYANEEFSIDLTTYDSVDIKVMVRNEDEAVEVKKVEVESEE